MYFLMLNIRAFLIELHIAILTFVCFRTMNTHVFLDKIIDLLQLMYVSCFGVLGFILCFFLIWIVKQSIVSFLLHKLQKLVSLIDNDFCYGKLDELVMCFWNDIFFYIYHNHIAISFIWYFLNLLYLNVNYLIQIPYWS